MRRISLAGQLSTALVLAASAPACAQTTLVRVRDPFATSIGVSTEAGFVELLPATSRTAFPPLPADPVALALAMAHTVSSVQRVGVPRAHPPFAGELHDVVLERYFDGAVEARPWSPLISRDGEISLPPGRGAVTWSQDTERLWITLPFVPSRRGGKWLDIVIVTPRSNVVSITRE